MKIVSFSRVVPYPGIPHAGGAYYLNHLDHLVTKHEVVVVAPNSLRNRAALGKYNSRAEVILAGDDSLPKTDKWVPRILAELRPASAPSEFVRAIRSDKHLQEVIRSAEIVEFQWSENASLIEQIKKLNIYAYKIVVMHDVLQQKYRRRLSSERGLKKRFRALLAFLSAWILEPARLRRSDAIIVFSNKDADLVRSAKPRAMITVVPPPLVTGDSKVSQPRDPLSVLFTGAMDRPENDQGIQWFIEQCWPTIRRAHPSATLTIAGASPTDELLQLASRDPSISVTGYVTELEPYYMKSGLFVVPLFQGAGVKFKTISAMLHGLPVVSTSVGAEGVGPSGLFGAISDEAGGFSLGVTRLLGDESLWREVSVRSSEWATQAYGLGPFRESLDKAYVNSAENL